MLYWINFKNKRVSNKSFNSANTFVNITEDSYIVWTWSKDGEPYIVACADWDKHIRDYVYNLHQLDVCPYENFVVYDAWVQHLCKRGFDQRDLTEERYLDEFFKVVVDSVEISELKIS